MAPLSRATRSHSILLPQLQTEQAWHVLELPEGFSGLDAGDSRPSEEEARARLQRYGLNRLTEPKPPSGEQVLLRQSYNLLTCILVFAGIAALVIGDLKDALFLVVALATNAAIGDHQEWTAERIRFGVRRLLRIQATVERDGDVRDMHAEELVPGDLIWLELGNRVPADARLLETTGLEINELLLTRESLPVRKDPNRKGLETAAPGDRARRAFARSIVNRGRRKGLVIPTGTGTSVGQLALDGVGTGSGKAPLVVRMDRLSKAIAVGTFVIAAMIGVMWGAVVKLPEAPWHETSYQARSVSQEAVCMAISI